MKEVAVPSIDNSSSDQQPPSEVASESHDELQRGLDSRHMNMIAIGGAIGTGLFLASGATISQAGPGGALVAFVVIGLMVFLLMQSLGEMSALMPVPGAFETYATRFVSPSFGFALGWNYWFNWAITVAAELSAAGIVMQYWLPDSPGWVWSVIFLTILVVLNLLSARAYGEGEFWFAIVKVIAVIVFLIVGVLMIAGIMGGSSPGTSNWTTGEAPFVNGFGGVITVFLVAGFSFQGTELIGVAAGESKDPRSAVPKATRQIFWRIMIFYIGTVIVMGFLLPYTNENLLAGELTQVAMSPFTIVLKQAGIGIAASLMNAVILTAILSAGNSGLYASTRMLYALAKDGKASAIFSRTNKRGVPVPAMALTTVVAASCFLSSLVGDGTAYTWLVSVSSLCGFIVWLGIAVSHFQFRRAYLKQGNSLDDLPFRAKLYPAGPILAFALCLTITLGQGWNAVRGADWRGILVAYVGIFAFVAVWLIHKLVTGARRADLTTASFDIDENLD